MARNFPIFFILGNKKEDTVVFILILFLLIINNAFGFSVIVILSKMMLIKVFEILLSKFIKLLIHCKVLTILNILFRSSFEFLLCSSRKYPYPHHGGNLKFQRGGGGQSPRKFQRGWGVRGEIFVQRVGSRSTFFVCQLAPLTYFSGTF